MKKDYTFNLDLDEIIVDKNNNKTLLMIAIENQLIDLAENIINNNCNLNIRDRFDNTALDYALKYIKNNPEIKRILPELLEKTNINFEKNENIKYMKTFFYDIKSMKDLNKDSELFNMLCEKLIITKKDINTLAIKALESNYLDFFIKYENDIDFSNQSDFVKQGSRGNSYLLDYIAYTPINKDVFDFLLQKSDINYRNKDGDTALFYAINDRNEYALSILTKISDHNIANDAGRPPLVHAIETNTPIRIIEDYLILYANYDMKYKNGMNIVEMLNDLINKGIKINKKLLDEIIEYSQACQERKELSMVVNASYNNGNKIKL